MVKKNLTRTVLHGIEDVFGIFGYVLSGVIVVFAGVLALYYALASFSCASPLIVQIPIEQSQAGLVAASQPGVILVAFATIVTFTVLIVTGVVLIRVFRWFIRKYSAVLHLLTKQLFDTYSARQFMLVKALVFTAEAGLLLGLYLLYPSGLLFTFLLGGVLLLAASLLCVAAQAIVVLTTRRAPSGIL